MTRSDSIKPPANFRETVEFYLIDYRTPLGKAIDITIIFMNLLVCAIFVIDTYPISIGLKTFLWRLEILAVTFFIIEYVARLYGAPSRRKQLVDIYSIIDLLAILPTLFQAILPLFGLYLNIAFVKTIRVFKVFRIFRFLRFLTDPNFFFGSVSLEVLKVARLVTTILIIFFISSGLFYYVESPVNDQVRNFGDAFYFTVVALTTVGFGDIIPVTEAGKWVTVLMILSGIILIPWEASQIVKEWILISKKTNVLCPQCGLGEHDIDADYCKRCGHYLYHEEIPEKKVAEGDRSQ
ncbi:MAG TPA: ion transporter [Methanothrix sp.]|nr:ion transporter [Methanothrix sp.]HPR66334.1 ion transporter [Methanothrix sp.]